jgi:hypothetical protein
MKTLLAVVIGAVLVGKLDAQRSPKSGAVALVVQLYADFACEAVVDTPGCDGRHQLVDQPRPVLARYFDDRLVQLWLADRACAARTHETCNLDFMPMWASQDPVGTSVKILPTADSTRVDVELRSSSSQESRTLRYTLTKMPAGWRIHDIARGKEWSLVGLLSKKG